MPDRHPTGDHNTLLRAPAHVAAALAQHGVREARLRAGDDGEREMPREAGENEVKMVA
jgi:hypothetical protein